MNDNPFFRNILSALLCFLLAACLALPSFALESGTLYNGCSGEEVRSLQEALITLGYLKGTADGIFGNKTENAVRKFQRKNKLVSDGLAGQKTQNLIFSKADKKVSSASVQAEPASQPASEPVYVPAAQTEAAADVPDTSSASSSLFGGNYATLRQGSRGSRVRTLQQKLIALNYLSGSADGVYGKSTRKAVKAFQRANKLTADGVAGKKTLKALESSQSPAAAAEPASSSSGETASSPAQVATSEEGSLNPSVSGPSASSVQLLRWYDDVKPSISGRQDLFIYDPSSGLSWTVRVLARGRHCDAEPVTAQDTRTMTAAFGGIRTWNQKAVYVRLPDGRWSLASTHDMPHDSGSIKSNDFNGHLCVHFFRDMEETKQKDPKYGVANQETIRAWWKRLTGQEITD